MLELKVKLRDARVFLRTLMQIRYLNHAFNGERPHYLFAYPAEKNSFKCRGFESRLYER